MSLTYKKITTVDEIAQLSDGATIFVNDNGVLRQAKIALFVSGTGGSDTAALHFKGLYPSLPTDVAAFHDGDVILVGEKEYIFYASAWFEFGSASTISGADGEDGVTYRPIIGSVQAGETMDDAAVYVNVDEATATASYSFVLPRGPRGPEGDPGVPGAPGAPGVGIAKVEQTLTSTSDGGVNVITVVLTNGQSSTFEVRNGTGGSSTSGDAGEDGVGILSLEQTQSSTESGGLNVYTATLTDGRVSSFRVYNGAAGTNGHNGVGIKTIEQTSESTEGGGLNILTVKTDDGNQYAFTVRNGQNGLPGSPGANGSDGGYYTPSVSTSGQLTWTASKSGMSGITSRNIMGPSGGFYIPSVNSDGDLSWSSSQSGMPAIPTVNIKGPAGDAAAAGYEIVASSTEPSNPTTGMIWFDIS